MNDIVSPEVQSPGVRDRLATTLNRTMQIAGLLESDKAREHMKHGLARRLRILHLGLSKIVAAYPRRKQPLSDDEQTRDVCLLA